jgi:hypothetical protein
LFFTQTGMLGGPAPVRRFLPHLIDLVLKYKINPGKVFDLELPLADVAALTSECTHKTACTCWRKRYPLYPQKQTSQQRESMSAKGQQQTYAPQQKTTLFDNLIGACKQACRHSQAKRLGRVEIDH